MRAQQKIATGDGKSKNFPGQLLYCGTNFIENEFLEASEYLIYDFVLDSFAPTQCRVIF